MSENIVTVLNEKLGFADFDKIDTNTPQGKKELGLNPSANHYTQAAVIASLVGLYKYGTTDEGSHALFATSSSGELFSKIFDENKKDVIQAVSQYGDRNYEFTKSLMQKITSEAVQVANKAMGENPTPETIRSYFAGQRHNILVYLPPDLKLGALINDGSVDDATNKMEGPVSGLMHFFEQLFSEKDKVEMD